MKHVYCPECGHRLLTGGEGSRVVIKCGRCGKLLEAAIDKGGIAVTVMDKGAERPTVTEQRIFSEN